MTKDQIAKETKEPVPGPANKGPVEGSRKSIERQLDKDRTERGGQQGGYHENKPSSR